MKRVILYPAAAFLTLIIGLYVHLYFTDKPGKFWRNFSGAQVTVNGKSLPAAAVYRHPDGNLLINSARQDGWYVFLPEERNMARCNPIEYVPIPGYIYAYRWHEGTQMPCALMTIEKVGRKADLIVGQSFIEFTSAGDERIRVSWSD
jgi:hypothetical protein